MGSKRQKMVVPDSNKGYVEIETKFIYLPKLVFSTHENLVNLEVILYSILVL